MRLIDADKLMEMIKENIEESGNFRMAILAEDVIDVINDYTEDYEAEEDYRRGLNDAWDAARKIALDAKDGGISINELGEIFGTPNSYNIMAKFTPTEAFEKIRAYEEQKKADEEIKVGDEVETDYTGNVIIAEKPKDGWYATIAKNFARYSIHESHIIKKTGRHFPQVAELLDAMADRGR